MLAIDAPRCRRPASQRGVMALEFALVCLMMMTMLFGVIELARAMYMWTTLEEATRRAARSAAVTDPGDTAAMDSLRQRALFRSSAGLLSLGAPVTDAYLRIDYLAQIRNADASLTMTPIATASLPACPASNRVICMNDPNAANCIRFVRVRICQPGGASCTAVPYQPLLPFTSLNVNLPSATSTARAETMGYLPGAALCP